VLTDCTLCCYNCAAKVERLASDSLGRGKLCPKAEANANLLINTRCREPIMGYQPDKIAFVWH